MDFRLNSEEFQNHVPSKMTPLQKVFCPFVSQPFNFIAMLGFCYSFIYLLACCLSLKTHRHPFTLYYINYKAKNYSYC